MDLRPPIAWSDIMKNDYNLKNSRGKPYVLTAKVVDQVFNKVEEFKADSQLDNRNAAINVLVIVGLCSLSYLTEDEARFLVGKRLWDSYFEGVGE